MSCCVFTDEEIKKYDLQIPSDDDVEQMIIDFIGDENALDGISCGQPSPNPQGTLPAGAPLPAGCLCMVCTSVGQDSTTQCADMPPGYNC